MVCIRGCLFLVFTLLSLLARAESANTKPLQKPTWELGVALGGQYLADYRGSDEYGSTLLPVPFFIYRGQRIKVDRGGLRGDLLNAQAWEFNVSGEVSLAGGREENTARRGMPVLDSAFEIGPSFNIALDGNVKDDGWLLRLPLRAVFALSVNRREYIGYLFNPKLTYTKDKGYKDWRISSSLGFNYASERYHDYYYQVDRDFVLDDRPFYDAEPGFSGIYSKLSVSRRTQDWQYGLSVRYDNIGATSFGENSPLVKTDHYFALSFIIAKFLWASDS